MAGRDLYGQTHIKETSADWLVYIKDILIKIYRAYVKSALDNS